MATLYQDEDDWQAFQLLRDLYIGLGQHSGSGLLESFTGDVDPTGNTFPVDTDEDGRPENYGILGWLTAATEGVYNFASDAADIADGVSQTLEVEDALRYKGIDSYLAKVEYSLDLVRIVVEGDEAEGQTPLEQIGVRGQIQTLLSDLEGAEIDWMLLPQGSAIIAIYNFLLDGNNNFDGINGYLANIDGFRSVLPI